MPCPMDGRLPSKQLKRVRILHGALESSRSGYRHSTMEIGGILILVLVILAIVYLAKRI